MNWEIKNSAFDGSRETGSVVITDPPYNVGYHYEGYNDLMPDDDYWDLLCETCQPPCVMLMYPEEIFKFSWAIGYFPDKCVTWCYPANTPRQHRMIAWFGIKPDFRKVGQLYKNPNDKRIAKRIAAGHYARLYDWWEINQIKNVSKEKTSHPCQIPFEVMRRVVGITPAKSVIDPFSGSGTTIAAAKYWDIPATGFDINQNYVEIGNNRIRDLTPKVQQLSLFNPLDTKGEKDESEIYQSRKT